MKGHVLPWPAENVISICCSFLSWLPAPLPEPWLLQSAAYLRVSLRLPGAPLWGGGSRAGVHPGRGRSEARSARDQPFPEGPTAEKARRQGYRCRQGPDPTTYNHQAASSTRVSAAAVPLPPLLNIAPKEPRPRQIWMAKQWPFLHQWCWHVATLHLVCWLDYLNSSGQCFQQQCVFVACQMNLILLIPTIKKNTPIQHLKY